MKTNNRPKNLDSKTAKDNLKLHNQFAVLMQPDSPIQVHADKMEYHVDVESNIEEGEVLIESTNVIMASNKEKKTNNYDKMIMRGIKDTAINNKNKMGDNRENGRENVSLKASQKIVKKNSDQSESINSLRLETLGKKVQELKTSNCSSALPIPVKHELILNSDILKSSKAVSSTKTGKEQVIQSKVYDVKAERNAREDISFLKMSDAAIELKLPLSQSQEEYDFLSDGLICPNEDVNTSITTRGVLNIDVNDETAHKIDERRSSSCSNRYSLDSFDEDSDVDYSDEEGSNSFDICSFDCVNDINESDSQSNGENESYALDNATVLYHYGGCILAGDDFATNSDDFCSSYEKEEKKSHQNVTIKANMHSSPTIDSNVNNFVVVPSVTINRDSPFEYGLNLTPQHSTQANRPTLSTSQPLGSQIIDDVKLDHSSVALAHKRREAVDGIAKVLEDAFQELEDQSKHVIKLTSTITSLEKKLTRRSARHELEIKLAKLESKIEKIEMCMRLSTENKVIDPQLLLPERTQSW